MTTTASSILALVPNPQQRDEISALELGPGLVLHVCSSPAAAERLLIRIRPDVVFAGCDTAPGWLAQPQAQDPDAFRLLACDQAGLAAAIDLVNSGGADALLRSPATAAETIRLLHHGCETALLRRHNRSLIDELAVRNNDLLVFNERLEELVADRTRHLVEAQEHLQEQQRQMVQLETQSTVTHLLRGLAHEFNNPLAAIFGYAQRLRRTQAAIPEVVRRVDVILQEVEHCRTVVQQLAQLATPLAEEAVASEPEPVLEAACARLRASGLAAPAITLPERLPAVIAAPRALARVFEQVLANAVEAGARTVTISGNTIGNQVRLILDNDGETPEATVISNAIRPFFSSRAAQGHRGLGLSTAAALLREQDGTIELSTRSDGQPGAATMILLPAAEPQPRRPSASGLRPVGTGSPGRSDPLTLVVDDEPLIAELLAEVLRERGCATVIANSFAQAVEVLSQHDIAALVVDMHLPDGSGLDLARRAVVLRPALHGHIALTTGESDHEMLERLVAEHGFPVLTKPFRLEAVASLLTQIG